jgi:hypothetical protein
MESVATNPVRPDVSQDRAQRTEQQVLLEGIAQFVVFVDHLQNFVDHYWDLDHVSAKLLRDPSYENFSEVRPKLDLTVRDLGQVAKAMVGDLGHSPDDSKKVNDYLKDLRNLSVTILDFADMQVESNDTKLTQVMRRIRDVADLARVRAIEAYHDVNNATQIRLARLNMFFPEDDGNRGAGLVAQLPPTIPPASSGATMSTAGRFQADPQRLTKGIDNDFQHAV